MKKIATSVLALCALASVATADGVYQTLPFSQNWTNTGLITTNDDWSGVPGIIGYLGNHDLSATPVTNVDPQTLTTNQSISDTVMANQPNPNTQTSGGVAEFDALSNPVVAMQGSGTADAPYLVIHLNTAGYQNISVAYNLRDVDGSLDNSVQQYVMQYRLGNAGAWTNVAGTYVPDASSGPSNATLVTPIAVVLPPACDNAAQLQLRIMTTNASGSDEWVGVDDIAVDGLPIGTPAAKPSWGQIKTLYR